MKLLAITDRRTLKGSLEDFLARALAAGVDALQLREKDLPTREILRLAEHAGKLPNPHRTLLLLNGRTDVALAAGLDGVHLPSAAPAASRIRDIVPEGFQIGASCHSADELRRCEQEGVDYALLSPIFHSAAKPEYGPPLGVGRLEQACRSVAIPVYALGGIDPSNAGICMEAHAAGVAGISLFQQAPNLSALVAQLRGSQ